LSTPINNQLDWVSCDYAARYLTKRLKEDISKADVLMLSLNGKLTLSLFLPNPVWVLLGNFIEVDDIADHFPRDSGTWIEEGDWRYDYDHNVKARRFNLYNEWASDKDTLIVDGARNQVFEIKSEAEIEGVWDLTMRGGERGFVHGLSLGKSAQSIHPKGMQCVGDIPVVSDPSQGDHSAYAILPELPFVRFLPKNSSIVLRRDELESFASRSSSQPQSAQSTANPKDTERLKRMQAVLDFAQSRWPKGKRPEGLSYKKMAELIVKQQKDQGYGEDAVRQILGGSYKPMKRLGLEGLD
jgi:hypothetical protein